MTSDRRGGSASVESIPTDLIRKLLGAVTAPGDVESFARALTRRTTNALRCRRGVSVESLPIATEPVDWYGLAHRPIDPEIRPASFLSYAAGDYYIQDAGSLLALSAAGADTSRLKGQLICDLCAAPGGKASALVEAIADGDSGFVLCNEAIRSRVAALQFNLARTGSDRFAVCQRDPESLAERLPGVFDVVVVDAPCSGQALLARRKQSASSLSEHQIQHSASRQRRILDAAVQLIRPGGTLIYSTCTFAEAENELQVERLIEAQIAIPQRVDHLSRYETRAGCYRLWPHTDACAGSFAASLNVTSPHDRDARRTKRGRSDNLPVDLNQWYRDLDSTRLHVRDSVLMGWPLDAPEWVEELAVSGPELAHRVGQTWRPAHAGALRRGNRARSLQSVDLDDETATRYMKGQPIPSNGNGWQVVRAGDRPLGWIKTSGSTGKNHLPAAART